MRAASRRIPMADVCPLRPDNVADQVGSGADQQRSPVFRKFFSTRSRTPHRQVAECRLMRSGSTTPVRQGPGRREDHPHDRIAPNAACHSGQHPFVAFIEANGRYVPLRNRLASRVPPSTRLDIVAQIRPDPIARASIPEMIQGCRQDDPPSVDSHGPPRSSYPRRRIVNRGSRITSPARLQHPVRKALDPEFNR